MNADFADSRGSDLEEAPEELGNLLAVSYLNSSLIRVHPPNPRSSACCSPLRFDFAARRSRILLMAPL
jgi:hypothetical protein